MRKRLYGTIATAILIAGALVAPSAANASDGASSSHLASAPTVLSDEQAVEIELLALVTDRKARTFDADTAAARGVSDQYIADFAAVVAGEGWTVVGEVTSNPSDSALAAAAVACTGFQGYHGYYPPWGIQFGLNSCETGKLITAAGMGAAGAGAITAILVLAGVTAYVAAISGVVAAIIGLGAAAFAACQAYSSKNAIWLNVVGTPPVSCWAQ